MWHGGKVTASVSCPSGYTVNRLLSCSSTSGKFDYSGWSNNGSSASCSYVNDRFYIGRFRTTVTIKVECGLE